jgi:hypothetical protein
VSSRTVKRVVVAAAAAGLLYVAASFLLRQGDDEDRPPIIVKNGSMVIEIDVPGNVRHRWKKDLIGRQWKPEHPNGRKVDRFDVSYTDAPGCTAMSGSEVSITYTETGGTVREYHFKRKRLHGLGKREPKFESPVDLVEDDTQTRPRLTYGIAGRITSVVVSTGAQSQTCSMPSQGEPTVTVKPQAD